MRVRLFSNLSLALSLTALVGCGADGNDAGETSRVTGQVGDTLKTADDFEQDGEPIEQRIEITLLAAKDRAKSEDEFDTLEPGNRWLRARFRLRQTGSTKTSLLSAQFAAGDAEGQMFEADPLDPFKPALTAQGNAIDLSPGESRTGFLAFQIPKEVGRIEKIQFRDDGFGPAPDVAEWRLSR